MEALNSSWKSQHESDKINNMVTSNVDVFTNYNAERLNVTLSENISRNDTSNDIVDYKDWEDYVEYKLTVALWKYMSPIILVIGLIGNLLSILVLRCTSMKRAASSVYLTALALSDLSLLVVSLSNDWVDYMFDFNIQTIHTWACKIHTFLLYVFTDISAWMLVCVSLERAAMVYWPIRVKTIFSPCRIMVSIITIVTLLCVVNVQWLFTLVVRETTSGEIMSLAYESLQVQDTESEAEIVCIYKDGTEEFRSRYWPWIDACVASFLPFTILIICNILIVAKLTKSKKFRKESTYERKQKNNDATRSITIMLIVTSFMFLLLTAPFVIYLIIWRRNTKSGYASKIEIIHSDLMISIFDMLIYCNSAINFILYCLSGKMFREALMELFCRRPPTKLSHVPSRHSDISVLHPNNSPAARYYTDARAVRYNTTAAKYNTTAAKYNTTAARYDNSAMRCDTATLRGDTSAISTYHTNTATYHTNTATYHTNTAYIQGDYMDNIDMVLGETLHIGTLEITKF